MSFSSTCRAFSKFESNRGKYLSSWSLDAQFFFLEMQSLSPMKPVAFKLSMDATTTLSFSLVVSSPLLWYPLDQLLQANAWSDASSWCALLGTASQCTKHSSSVKDKDLYTIANYLKCIQSVIGWGFCPPLLLTFHFIHVCIYPTHLYKRV